MKPSSFIWFQQRHHIAVTLGILEQSNYNFLTGLNKEKLNKFKNLLREIILATDLTVHFKLLPEEEKMADDGFDKHNKRHQELLLSVLISCADLSDQTKKWSTVHRVAKFIFSEFFDQGDQERKLGIMPTEMMDRYQAKIPQLQVDFLSHVIIPDFKVLLSLYPETQICMDNIKNNLVNWWKAVPYFEEELGKGRNQLDILDDTKLDDISALT